MSGKKIIQGLTEAVEYACEQSTARMTELVERLRQQGQDAFAKQYSLGMWQLCAEAADEIERLRAALQKIVDEADSDDGLTAWDGSDIARAALR